MTLLSLARKVLCCSLSISQPLQNAKAALTMNEDRVEEVQVPQPEVADNEVNNHTPESGEEGNTPGSGVNSQIDLQRLAQQASNAVNLSNGILNHDPDGKPVDVAPNPLVATHAHEIQGHLNGDLEHPILRGIPTDVAAPVHGDNLVGEGNSGNLGPFPDIGGSELINETAFAWERDPNSDGSFAASQPLTCPSVADSEEQHQIKAFAKLEFDDGEFYMTTYAVELGRDIHAARQAFERDLEAHERTDSKSRKRSAGHTGTSITSERENLAGSVVSESGGVISGHNGHESKRKTKQSKSKSSSSSSRPLSRKSSVQFPANKVNYNALAMASLMDPLAMDDIGPENPLPSPDLIPLIPIHPPTTTDDGPAGHKSISRKHIKIAFNFTKHYFQVEIMGRNGCFVDDEWYAAGVVQPLVNGSIIQIGNVGIRFVLPDVPPGETGAELGMETDLLGNIEDLNYDMPDSNSLEEDEEIKDEGDEEEEEEEEEERDVGRRRAKAKKKPEPPPPQVPKRKGPGRPPKNGIISKREQALLARQAREEAKAAAQRGSSPAPVRGKGKTGRDAKPTKQEEANLQPNGKRKYTKRKRAGGIEDQQGARESTEQTDSVPPEQTGAAAALSKPAKEKKPPKPPRSPSPVFDESTMTPEQLAKPSASYVVLIHEALKNSATGQMSLPQIYRAIERRYPFYKLRVQTQGWQSSVRHNLSQHPAFRKIERDGKGWMWGLVPEVSIEKEKKRRTTPPPATQQQHYYPPGPPPMMQRPYQYPGMPPMNGVMPPAPYGMRPGMPHPLPPYGRGFPLPLVTAQSETTYQSPYQSTPPPPATQSTPRTQQPLNTNGANSNSSASTTQPPPQQTNGNSPLANTAAMPSLALNSTQNKPYTEDSTAPEQNNRTSDVSQAIAKFKSAIIAEMEEKTKAQALVTSAINRTLGIQGRSSSGTEEDPQERTIMDALAKMLGELSKKNMEVNGQSVAIASHSDPKPATKEGSPLERTAVAIAAENAAKTALTNGNVVPSQISSIAEAGAGTKRPLENGDDAQPEAKRVASG